MRVAGYVDVGDVALPPPGLDRNGKQKPNQLHYFSGATLQGKKAPAGFAVRVTAAGTRSFVLFHRFNGKPYWETLGRWDENPQGGTLTVRDAIIKADRLAKDLKNGRREDPRRSAPSSTSMSPSSGAIRTPC